jgi:hypothetical protein
MQQKLQQGKLLNLVSGCLSFLPNLFSFIVALYQGFVFTLNGLISSSVLCLKFDARIKMQFCVGGYDKFVAEHFKDSTIILNGNDYVVNLFTDRDFSYMLMCNLVLV